jgi:hypothetical protein
MPVRFSLKRLLVIVAVISVILAGVGFLRNLQNTILDAYRVWDAARALEAYMDAHAGEWPRDWDELARFAERTGINSIGGTFATLRQHVMIDFQFDPATAAMEISEDDVEPNFKVVWLRNGSSVHWAGAEPNTLILDYLKSKKFGDAARPGNTGVDEIPQ